jgi:FkbM family methyltransferase
VYHLIPRRQRHLRALYAQFASAGELVFDIGAHVGNRTRALTSLGCRVVALEPQPHVAATLRTLVGRRADVTVVEAAVAAVPGRAMLSVSERTPTVSTLADGWRAEREGETGFAAVRWNDRVEVDTVTLDGLIERYGVPVFIKLDIEGGEEAALSGLSRPVRGLSFEYLSEALATTAACIRRLEALGPYRFNWAPGESHRLASSEWLDGAACLSALHAAAGPRHGDVYARLLP